MINSMHNRILIIRNKYPEEKLDNLDNKKLLKEINNIYLSSTNEIKLLNNKIKRKADQEILRDSRNLNPYEEKRQEMTQMKLNNKEKNTNLIIYNETLAERQKEYESIYE